MTTFIRMTDEQIEARITKALRQAYQLGQIYWQQADSEYVSQHKKADETASKFRALIDSTVVDLVGI